MIPETMTMQEEQRFGALLSAALEEARQGLAEGGIPIGAALGDATGRIVSRGHNLRVQSGDPLAHAEISCLRNAGRRPHFHDLTLASTLMPCCLCAGAAIQFGIRTVVVGEQHNFAGEQALMVSRGIRVIDFNHPECIQLMADFIRRNPTLWNEDIGV